MMLWWMDKNSDQPIRNNLIIYGNILKIATGQGDNYPTGCLLEYIYFKNYCKNDCNQFK